MFSLRKIASWVFGVTWGQESEAEKPGMMVQAGTREQNTTYTLAIIGIVVLFGVALVGVWTFSLVSPTFDLTPTELGREGATQPSPVADALQEIGSLSEGIPAIEPLYTPVEKAETKKEDGAMAEGEYTPQESGQIAE